MSSRTLAELTEADLASEGSSEDPDYVESYDDDDEEDSNGSDVEFHRRLASESDRAYARWFETHYDELESIFSKSMRIGKEVMGNAHCQHLRMAQWTRFVWQHTV